MAKKLYKSFLIVTIFNVVTRLISFVFHVYLSRELGAENIGIFQIACSMLILFVCFSSSGFPVTLSRKIAHYDAIGEYTHSDSMLTSTLIMTSIISTFICCFFYIFPSSLNSIFTNPNCHKAFMLLLPSLISMSIYSTLRSWFWGKKKYTLYSATELVDEICEIIAITIVLSIGMFGASKYNAIALGHSIGDIVCVIILIVIFIIFGGKLKKPSHFKEIAVSATPITTTRLIGSLISSMIALILPTLLVGGGLTISEATSEYGRMSGMVMPIILAPGTIVSSLIVVLIPDLASIVSKKGILATHDKIKNCIIASTLISGVFMSIFVICGNDIGMLLYNDEKVGNMIVWSTLIIIPLVLNQLTASILNTLGKENVTFISSLISSIGMIITIICTSKSLLIYTYPLSLFVYHLIGLMIGGYKLINHTKINTKFIISVIFISIVSFVICSVLGLVKRSYDDFNIILRLAISTILILFLYSIFLYPYIKKVIKGIKARKTN